MLSAIQHNTGGSMQTSTLLIPIVQAATEDLNIAELAALNEAVQTGRDPRPLDSYARLRDLFTENAGSRMHCETRVALAAVTLSRLTQSC
jgi:hypothetical protein